MQISTAFAVSAEGGSAKESANLPLGRQGLRGVRPTHDAALSSGATSARGDQVRRRAPTVIRSLNTKGCIGFRVKARGLGMLMVPRRQVRPSMSSPPSAHPNRVRTMAHRIDVGICELRWPAVEVSRMMAA
jgi:hypothetical protein